ncbi:hypothetical protein [Pyxidicoccus xibeiensis]|uniref:hypothetical protein n=1 Tax=Pyxidicoccus xibeiensis TaxID=2906759 RepID=UPI0020A73788|nr:hypothetical protein [Pyxidicoccus xibeiensis]MCP3136151.1 hypothetical protein [Pyxidicoccus xibeiensis]
MKTILMQLACAVVLVSASAHAEKGGTPAPGEGSVAPEPLRIEKNRTAEEVAALKSQQCSNDAFTADVKGKKVPEARDALVRFAPEQKQALKRALAEGKWVPPPVKPEVLAEQQRYLAEAAKLERALAREPARLAAEKAKLKARVPAEQDRGE